MILRKLDGAVFCGMDGRFEARSNSEEVRSCEEGVGVGGFSWD